MPFCYSVTDKLLYFMAILSTNVPFNFTMPGLFLIDQLKQEEVFLMVPFNLFCGGSEPDFDFVNSKCTTSHVLKVRAFIY